MSLTSFNRARRLAAEKSGKAFEEISYEEAIAILKAPEPQPETKSGIPDLETQPEVKPKAKPKPQTPKAAE